ncbi:MAG TPA: HDOD domain-containing protein [Novimethylophilus sp.]|uniref:HDOD domain-containing protein n=1 Tax=Novimethylophilus sp. TaxID=2137426 RepID=UPI002F3EFCE1
MNDKLNFAELKTAGVLPSPKGVALTIMKLCQTENVSLPELAHIIQADPVLAGRIIKVANIVNPNKSRPIASVSIDTLILIGIHAVRQVVLGFSLITSYREGACKAFDYHRYWSRSVAMASIAQALGAALRVAPPAEMFTCGLLSGIGRLGMAAARPAEYSDLLEQLPVISGIEFTAAEIERFGMSHNKLSAEMMTDWGIPKLFIDAVFFHENPENSGFAEGSRQQKLTCALQLAALLADVYLAAEEAHEELMRRVFRLAGALNLETGQIVNIANQTLTEWHEWGRLLNIKTSNIAPFRTPDEAPPAAIGENGHHPLPPASATPVLRILLADTDETLVALTCRELNAAGHTVFSAKNGRQAFEIAEREQPQVIIADWLTPETGAVTLCRRIREQSWGSRVYFIMLSALEDEYRQIEAFEAGADACMKKPFQPRLLNARLLAAQRRFSKN